MNSLITGLSSLIKKSDAQCKALEPPSHAPVKVAGQEKMFASSYALQNTKTLSADTTVTKGRSFQQNLGIKEYLK